MNYTPQTEVYLLSGIPLNFYYNNTLDFKDINEQTNYFINKKKYYFDKLTYQRVNVNTIKLEIPYDELLSVNYMMFKNGVNPNKWYYAFITDYEFISQSTTQITYQLDVMQTYLFDYKFQSTYVEREHTKRFTENGLPIINTLDEGLNYGSEYITTNITHYEQLENIIWAVIVSKVDLSASGITLGGSKVSNIPTPLYFYVTPIDITANRGVAVNGFLPYSVDSLFSIFSQDPEWVGSIVSMYYTAYIPLPVEKLDDFNITCSYGLKEVTSRGVRLLQITEDKWFENEYIIYPDMYNNFPNYKESKLYMYPYSLIELTNQKGDSFTLKMENFSADRNEFKVKVLSSIGTSPKTEIIPMNYLNNTIKQGINDLSYGIIDNDVSDIPIIDDYTASYIQANKNTINATNQYALDNASRGVYQNNANNRLQNAIIDRQQMYNTTDMEIGAISSVLSGNLGGAVSSVYQGIKNYDLREANRSSMNLNNKFANDNLRVNAEQSIGMTQAKMQDINNIPPTISNLGNNSLFSYGNKVTGMYIICKTIKPEYAEQLTNYFKMFGYKVNKLEIPNTKSRKFYNYIKCCDANIIGNIPEAHLSTIRAVFDKGVTIWHTDDIGNYDVDNSEV